MRIFSGLRRTDPTIDEDSAPPLLMLLIDVVADHDGQAITTPQTVVVRSGTLQLRALLFPPKGSEERS